MLRVLRFSAATARRVHMPGSSCIVDHTRSLSVEAGKHNNMNVKVPSRDTNPVLEPLVEDDEEQLEEMFQPGPSLGKVEWGGPTRGGSRPEPTRYGDWDRNGRCSDF